MARKPQRQSGAVLFVAMIMLVLLTLIAVSVIRLTTTNVQVVGNEQFRTEAQTAANFALDRVINNEDFTDICIGTGCTVTYPVSLTTSDSYTDVDALDVIVGKPTCTRYRYIKKSELVTQVGGQYTVSASDATCIAGLSSSGITINDLSSIAPISDDSLCTTALFGVTATVNDPVTGASVAMDQGIEVRLEATDAETKCDAP